MSRNKEDKRVGNKITPKPIPERNIGIDYDNEFWDIMSEATTNSQVDVTSLNALSNIAQNRETLYQTLDTMAQDPIISAMLEIYTEDATETNENGDIVWVEAEDSEVSAYVNFLLESLRVDKHIYKWMHSLVKYGDVYLKLFRESDFSDDLLTNKDRTTLNEKFEKAVTNETSPLNEARVVAYTSDDRLVNYVDLVPNPAEMFELTKFGKSYAYVKANNIPTLQENINSVYNLSYLYKFRRRDVLVYNAVSYVHGALEDNGSRTPEQIQIFLSDNIDDISATDTTIYTVRRGQSILAPMYKKWRQIMLLEASMLLNRLTKSSLVRIIEVETADLPKEQVKPYLMRIKSMLEQKASLNVGENMSEYTNPGPMENNVYVPTHNGVGAINIQQLGGDVNVKDIADIDYFKNGFYSASRIPKQFLGDTDDATGFNGGTSLSIVSSRYAKTIKRIQAVMLQTLTDAINILLLDRGLDRYVNQFTLRMQEPVSQEELDKREARISEIGIVRDVMDLITDLDDESAKLRILKSLLAQAINNQEVLDLIQDEIDNLTEEEADESLGGSANDIDSIVDERADDSGDFESSSNTSLGDLFADEPDSSSSEPEGDELPTPADLGAGDLSDN